MTSFETAVAQRLGKLPDRSPRPPEEQTVVITVRLKRELHSRLKDQAWKLSHSLNGLCVALLDVGSAELQAHELQDVGDTSPRPAA